MLRVLSCWLAVEAEADAARERRARKTLLLLLLLHAIIMQNPQITNGMPVAMENEVFVLSRAGIHFTAKSGRVKAEGSGNLFLSTLRMVFVADKGHHLTCPSRRCTTRNSTSRSSAPTT